MSQLIVAAIIPVRNRVHFTQQILADLYKQIALLPSATALKLDIIVVDDGSTDGTPETIETQFPQIHLIRGDGSLWWTGAIEKGMRYAHQHLAPDYILWLNDDINLSRDFLDTLTEVCLSHQEKHDVLGGIVLSNDNPDWIAFGGVKFSRPIRALHEFDSKKELLVDTLNGNIAVFPISVIHKIGFPNAFKFRHYGGDYEYFVRAKVAGFKIKLLCDLRATTDFDENDIIRYMPPWMQYRLAQNLSEKLRVIQGLTSLKTNYNIWHMVNSMNRQSAQIHPWQYVDFYARKVVQILLAQVRSRRMLEHQLNEYLEKQLVPDVFRQRILDSL